MSPLHPDKLTEDTASLEESSCESSVRKEPPQRRRSCLVDNSSPKEGPKKTVNFDDVHIREFKVTLGDNPSVTEGPPVTLDWTPVATHVLGVDQYETTGGSNGSSSSSRPREKRSSAELKMPSSVRKDLLNGEHTKQEMKQAEAAARRIKSQRTLSMALVDMEGIELAWQSVLRKIKKWSKRNEPLEPAQIWIQQWKLDEKLKKKKQKRASTGMVALSLDRTCCTVCDDESSEMIQKIPKVKRCQSSPNLPMMTAHQEAMHARVAARKKVSG